MVRSLQCCWWPYRLEFRTPLATARGELWERRGLIVELRTPDGVTGLGDVAPWPGSEAQALREAEAWLTSLRQAGAFCDERSLCQALDRVPALADGARAARAAVETALLDLKAQREGVMLARWLHPTARLTVAVNALIGLLDVETTVTAACQAVAAGYSTLKLKVRLEPSEAERVAAVRAAVGSTVRLRLDANGAATVEQALAFARAVAPLDVEYLEQPVGTLEELAELRRRSPVPVAADEVLLGLETVERALALAAADVHVLKVPLLGGPRRLLAAVEQAARCGVEAVVTSVFESGIGLAAALHTAAALPGNERAHGLATAVLLRSLGTVERFEPVGGRLRLPPGSGLGVRWDEGQAGR